MYACLHGTIYTTSNGFSSPASSTHGSSAPGAHATNTCKRPPQGTGLLEMGDGKPHKEKVTGGSKRGLARREENHSCYLFFAPVPDRLSAHSYTGPLPTKRGFGT